MPDDSALPARRFPLRNLKLTIDGCLQVLHVASLNNRYFPAIFNDLSKRYQDAICALRLLIDTFSQAQMEDVDDEVITELENFTQFLCDCHVGLVIIVSELGLHVRFPQNGPLCSERILGRRIAEDKILEKIGTIKNPETQQHVYRALFRYHSYLEDICEDLVFPGQSLYGRLLQKNLEKCERDLSENMRRHRDQIDFHEREVNLTKSLILDVYNSSGNASGDGTGKYEEIFVDSLTRRDRLQEQVEVERTSIVVVRQILNYCGLVR